MPQPWNQALLQVALAPWTQELYLETKIWELGVFITISVSLFLGPQLTDQENLCIYTKSYLHISIDLPTNIYECVCVYMCVCVCMCVYSAENKKCWQECGETGTFVHWWWHCKMVVIVEKVWWSLKC